jgi:hypothetical protein
MTMKRKFAATALASAAALAALAGPAQAGARQSRPTVTYEVTVEVTNLAPSGGTLQTPVWVGFHDGSFDIYDRGVAASPELERLAEDGAVGPLAGAFATSGAGEDATVFGPDIPPIRPGETSSVTFLVEVERGRAEYFSYASMVIPSNDAFVANGNPTAHRIFNNGGKFIPTSFVVTGAEVLDAGTEVNDEVPGNTAALAQAVPNTGDTKGGTVALHQGFDSNGNILAAIGNGDFTADGYQNLRVDISAELVGRTPGPRG